MNGNIVIAIEFMKVNKLLNKTTFLIKFLLYIFEFFIIMRIYF